MGKIVVLPQIFVFRLFYQIRGRTKIVIIYFSPVQNVSLPTKVRNTKEQLVKG